MPHYEQVPEGWCICHISDVASSSLGKTLDKEKNKGHLKNYLCALNVQWGYIDFSTIKQFRLEENEFQRYCIKKGDLLVCEGGDVGRAAIWEHESEFYYQNAIHRIRFKENISEKWFMYQLRYLKNIGIIDNACKGVTIKHLTQNVLNSLSFTLPPLPEQQRIVAEIERWFALIDQIEQGKADLRTAIKQAKNKILDLAIHGKLVPQDPNDEPASELLKRINPKAKITCDNAQYGNVPFQVPEGWVWCKLNELCNIKGGKRIPKGKKFSAQRTEHIYLRVTNMKNRTISFDDLKYIDDDVFQELKNYTISSSDLYLTIAGTIGDVGEIPQEVSGMNLTENAAKLTDIVCDRLYLMYSLLSTNSQEHFCSKFHQVAQPKLSIETASATLLPLPPHSEQQRIVSKIEELFAELDKIESSLQA